MLQWPNHAAVSGIADSEAQKAMGARLQAIRQALGLSQEDMADHMGIAVSTLSAWEIGRNQIDIVKLAKAATRFGFTTDWVARGDLSGIRKDLADILEGMASGDRSPRGRPRGRPKGPEPPAPYGAGRTPRKSGRR